MSITALKGGADLAAFLDAFPKKLQNGAIRSGATAAAKPIRDQARANAPRKTGKLAKAVKTGSPRVDGSQVRIRVRLAGEHSFLGMFFEYGVRPHYITAGDSGKSPRLLTRAARDGGASDVEAGKLKIGDNYITGAVLHPGITAQPFMRPALDARANEAIKAFGARVQSYLKDKSGLTAPATLDVDDPEG